MSRIISAHKEKRRRELRRRSWNRLRDAGGRADGGRHFLAERCLVDEVVLDHCRGDVRLVDPDRDQQNGGVLAAASPRGRGGGGPGGGGRRGGVGRGGGG